MVHLLDPAVFRSRLGADVVDDGLGQPVALVVELRVIGVLGRHTHPQSAVYAGVFHGIGMEPDEDLRLTVVGHSCPLGIA